MLTSATETEFTAFLSTYGYTVAQNSASLLALSFLYLNTLPFCDADQDSTNTITTAQCLIAYNMSTEGGAWNPVAQVERQGIKSKKVDTLEKEFFEAAGDLAGTDAMSLLRSLPMAYALLSPYLCATPVVSADSHQASVWVV